jgi:6-phosphogluconate dehydrogenase (decarboxylating)
MQLGMIGLGRMGANMVRRLLKAGHQCVVFRPKRWKNSSRRRR